MQRNLYCIYCSLLELWKSRSKNYTQYTSQTLLIWWHWFAYRIQNPWYLKQTLCVKQPFALSNFLAQCNSRFLHIPFRNGFLFERQESKVNFSTFETSETIFSAQCFFLIFDLNHWSINFVASLSVCTTYFFHAVKFLSDHSVSVPTKSMVDSKIY